MVFAARGIKDEAADGGFHWEAVGNQRTAMLDTDRHERIRSAVPNPRKTRKNARSTGIRAKDAEDPRVAGGTMNPANPTVPWVTWDEDVEGVKQVFVSRLVTTPSPHFEIVNGGTPISTGPNDSTRPDITFSGNTPYVSWRRGRRRRDGEGLLRPLRQPGKPDVRARRKQRSAHADGRRRTCASRSPRPASRRRSTRTARPARAERWARRSSCSPTERTRGACSRTPTSRKRPSPVRRAASAKAPATVSGPSIPRARR